MNGLLAITSSPHFRSRTTTHDIMLDVLIALMPALLASIFLFGFRALLVSVVCVTASVLFEYFYRRWMKLSSTVYDLSAAVTGLLIAFNLPATLPLWMAIVGCFVAVVIVKQLFGGLGKNFANPAIVARIVLVISFATPMTNWILPRSMQTVDAVTGPTPLTTLHYARDASDYWQMLLGQMGGSLGETCKLALLIGGVYLVARKVISATTPLAVIGSVFIFAWILGEDPLAHVLAGGVILGAIFMATDYVTTPTTEWGKLIFGVGCGLITVVIRMWSSYPEGMSFAILLMNIATPHIDRLTSIKAFGGAVKS